MSLYKYDDNGYYVGEFPENNSGNIPLNYTLISPPTVASGNIAKFDNTVQLWHEVQDYNGTYYKANNGDSIEWEKHYEPFSSYYITVAPTVPYPTWDGTQWIVNNTLRLQTELSRIVCDLPNGLLIPIIKREDFKNSLDEMDILKSDTAVIDETVYRRVEIEYALAYFEYETQRIYND